MVSLMPRSATYPTLAGSGRSSGVAGGLAVLASRGQSFESLWSGLNSSSPRSNSSSSSAGLNSSVKGVGPTWRAVAVAIALLYGLALITLPLAYVKLSSGGIGSALDVTGSNSLAPGALAGNRRMALQNLEWPDTGLAQRHYGSRNAAMPRVEFRDAGYIVDLETALDATAWKELPLYHPSPVFNEPAAAAAAAATPQKAPGAQASSLDNPAKRPRFPAWCPQSDVRVFIGVTSRCCTKESQAKRMAQRSTWMKDVQRRHPNVVIKFILAQPGSASEAAQALEILSDEIQQFADIIVVPGRELYRYLPNKTLQLLKYGLSSPCQFTHILKTDDDVYLRIPELLNIIRTGQHDLSMDIMATPSSNVTFDGQVPTELQAPWTTGMYVGQLDSNKTGLFPGWAPLRDAKNKWYLSEEDLPDELAAPLLGVRWISGWGYMLSRDMAEIVAHTAEGYAAAPNTKPGWWGRMPWEDIMVAAILKDAGGRASHHGGFKAAWNDCGPDTVLKHLDNDAPLLQEGLGAQDASGLWARHAVVCGSGPYTINNYTEWRTWRNSLPDNQLGGFM